MALFFNSVLEAAQIDPAVVRLMRHNDKRADKDRRPYRLWLDFPDDFVTYQARQNETNAKTLRKYDYWASFVVTPNNETLFACLYKVAGPPSVGEKGVPVIHIRNAREENPYMVFPLEKSNLLQEYEGKLIIEWGTNYINWHQAAATQNKKIIELRPNFKEPDWPGYLRFRELLSQIEILPSLWCERLREAKGIYLLTCPKTKEHYVGSARGNEGFYGRWLQHLAEGGDAIGFRSREPSDYQVTILEIAGSGASDRDILNAEQLWITKLQSSAMGINNSPRLARSVGA